VCADNARARRCEERANKSVLAVNRKMVRVQRNGEVVVKACGEKVRARAVRAKCRSVARGASGGVATNWRWWVS